MRYGYRYPLHDATLFDDAFGVGFDHVEPSDAIATNSFYCVDCWIVDQVGNRHPGYSVSPTPVRREMANQRAGFPIADGVRREIR